MNNNKQKKTLVKKDTMGFKDPFKSKLINKKSKKEPSISENIIKEEAETEREINNNSKIYGSIEENESQELSLVSSEKEEEENSLNESSLIDNQTSSIAKIKEDTKTKLSISTSSDKNVIIPTVVLPKITNKKINNFDEAKKADNIKIMTISSSSSKKPRNIMYVKKQTINNISSSSPFNIIKANPSPSKNLKLSSKTPLRKLETINNKENNKETDDLVNPTQITSISQPVIEVLPIQSQIQAKTPKNIFSNLLKKPSSQTPDLTSERRRIITFGLGKVLVNAFSPLKKQTTSTNDKNILGISKLTLELLNLRDLLLKSYYGTELRNHLITKIPIDNIENKHNNTPIYCKICENLPYLPVECINCELIYCLECVKENQKCLTKNCELNPRKVSKSMVNIYQNLEIKCKNNNCSESLTLKSYFQHEPICNFRLVKCSMFQCQVNIQYIYLEKHLSDECLYNLIICKYCSCKYPSKQISNHSENCLERLVKCDGCENKVKLENLKSHKLECIFLTFNCNMCLQDFYTNEKLSHNCYNDKVEELANLHKSHSSLFENKIKSEHLLKQENINLNRRINILESSLRKEEIINNILKEDNQLNLIRNIQLEQENINLSNEILIKSEQVAILNNKLNQFSKDMEISNNMNIAKDNTIQEKIKQIEDLQLKVEFFTNERNLKEANDHYLTNEISKISKIYSNNQLNCDNLTKEINFYKNLYKCVGCGVIANINNLEIFKNSTFNNKREDFNQVIKSLILLSNCNHCDNKICNFCVTNCSLCNKAYCINAKFKNCNECQENNICNECSLSCSYCSFSKCSKCYLNEGFDKTSYKCNYCSIFLSNKNKSSLISLLNDESCKTLQTETCISSFILASRGYLKGQIKYIVSFKNKFCRLNDFGILLIDNLNIANFDLKTKDLPNFNTCFIKKNSHNIVSFQKLYNNYTQSSANNTNYSFDQGISCIVQLNMDKSNVKFSINDITLEENCSRDKVFVPFFSLCNNELNVINHIEK